jgi:hypothetical protein
MTDHPHRVAIVVDPTFGERLTELSRTAHVWACDTPENRRIARRLWAGRKVKDLESGITLFKFAPHDSADEVCRGILETVELHHGEWSHTPPWSEVEVHGASLTPTLREAFVELDFREFGTTPDGFIAVRV